MSYCVNCGVELDSSAKKCALCSTPVINPNDPKTSGKEEKPYSDVVVIPPGVRRRYVAFLLSIIIAIPNVVCLLANFLFSKDSLWSVYVASSSALIWVVFILPFLWKKPKALALFAFNTAAVIAYTSVFYLIGSGGRWFFYIAVPVILCVAATVGVLIAWLILKKRDWPQIAVGICAGIAVTSFAIELLVTKLYFGTASLVYSVIIGACCIALIAFFAAVTKNRRLRAWLSRKFFV